MSASDQPEVVLHLPVGYSFGQHTAIVTYPDPVVTRHEDGTLAIDWRTSNGGPPTLPILCTAEMLQYVVDEHNKHVRAAGGES